MRRTLGEGTFELRLDPDRKPLYTTYQLRFTDAAKQLNPQPIRYEIEVLPDQTPEIEITQPGVRQLRTAAQQCADRLECGRRTGILVCGG